MQSKEHEVLGVMIVFIGNFNPAIFHPEWLVSKKLIRESEAETAIKRDMIVHSELSIFETDWFKIDVRPTRFEIRTLQEPYLEPLKDLVLSIFELLGETPLTAFGINYTKHFKFDNKKDYINFGYKLAPVNQIFDFLDNPRLMEFVVVDQNLDRKEDEAQVNIKIYPSDLQTTNAVAVNVNTHYSLKLDGRKGSKFLGNNWGTIIANSESTIEKLWEKLN